MPSGTLFIFKITNVDRAGKIEKVNGFGIKSVSFKEEDKITIAELDMIIEGFESREIIKGLEAKLQEKNDELTAEQASHGTTRDLLASAKESLSNEQADHEETKKANANLKTVMKTKDELIESLNDSVAKKDGEVESLIKDPVFTVDGKKLALTVAKSVVMYKNKVVSVTKEALKADPELLKFCVDGGFQIFKKLD